MERERERRQWEGEEWRDYDEQHAAEARRDEKIEVRVPPLLAHNAWHTAWHACMYIRGGTCAMQALSNA